MTAPDKIWATEDAENFGEDKFHTAHGPMKGLTEYTRTDLAQAAIAAAYEAAAQVAIGRKGFGSDAALVHPYDKGYVAACDAMATAIRALATPDTIAKSDDFVPLPRAEVEALLNALTAKTIMDANNSNSTWLDAGCRRVIATLQERMK